MTPPAARIVLDLVPGAEPVAGHVRAGRRTPVAFTGWRALFSALHDVLTQPAADAGDPTDLPAPEPRR